MTNCSASPRAVIVEFVELMDVADFTELMGFTNSRAPWPAPIYK